MRPEMARRWNTSPSHRSRGSPSTPLNRAPLSHVPQTVGLSLVASACSRFQAGWPVPRSQSSGFGWSSSTQPSAVFRPAHRRPNARSEAQTASTGKSPRFLSHARPSASRRGASIIRTDPRSRALSLSLFDPSSHDVTFSLSQHPMDKTRPRGHWILARAQINR